jgi:NodT family efflux transporter outer membrane factor (OMF) lipoprotein
VFNFFRHLSTRAPLLALILVGLALPACTVGPDYEVPQTETPDVWKYKVMAEMEDDHSPLEGWWLNLNDPKVPLLVGEALEANYDLKIAVQRVQESRALLGVATGRYYPEIGGSGTYQKTELSENGVQPLPPGVDNRFGVYDLGVGLTWEIDVFGRLRRTAESARASLEASIEDYRDVLVILLADVAANYVDVRTLQLRIEYAQSNVVAQQDTLQLTQDRFDAGLTSLRDVTQAESNLATTQATIPALEASLEAAINRLAVLLGKAPGEVDYLLSDPAKIPEPDEAVTMGIPADIVRRRPDIRAAERQLASQTARIGVAKADLYPTFTLSGLIGLQSTSSGSLFDSESLTWSILPGIQWPWFTGGRVQSQIRAEEARTQQAADFYQQTVLLALEEVETSLVTWQREKIRRDRLTEAVDATERTVALVNTQYLSGLTDFQSYLDAQRSLLEQQDNLASSEGRVVQSLIVLNRALGGGWELPDPESTSREIAVEIVEGEDISGREP